MKRTSQSHPTASREAAAHAPGSCWKPGHFHRHVNTRGGVTTGGARPNVSRWQPFLRIACLLGCGRSFLHDFTMLGGALRSGEATGERSLVQKSACAWCSERTSDLRSSRWMDARTKCYRSGSMDPSDKPCIRTPPSPQCWQLRAAPSYSHCTTRRLMLGKLGTCVSICMRTRWLPDFWNERPSKNFPPRPLVPCQRHPVLCRGRRPWRPCGTRVPMSSLLPQYTKLITT